VRVAGSASSHRAARPPLARRTSDFANSTRIWLILIAFLGLVNLFISYIGAGLEKDPRSQLFSWPAIVILGVVGLVDVWLSHRTGFPAAWDPAISNRQRILIPATIGVGIGLLEVALDVVFHGAQFFAAQHGLTSFNAPWPGSPLFYAAGAIVVEVFYRLLPIPLVVWLVSNLLLRGHAQVQVGWVLALLTSLIEPWTQDLPELAAGASRLLVASQFGPDLVFNLAQAVMFHQYGFFASILTRVSMYMVWHVAYGNFICNC
jgi:hypothetical protein